MTHGVDTSFLVAVEVGSHAEHRRTRDRFHRLLAAQDTFALVPQVLAEFIHVVSDPRRFPTPLEPDVAVERAETWWNADEVVQALPSVDSTLLFLDWLKKYRLGRKRLLDTMFASTLFANGVTSLLTLDRSGFEVFGAFDFPK
ncbi:MAG: PIN domain-containing protein [Verrucomicrobia bacterium]|nr:PIN domain-containing protein [Verrucomicrobiota bacterium]